MPPQQGLWLDEEPAQVPATEESAQPGEQSPIGWSGNGSAHLAAELRHLVAEHWLLRPPF